MNGLVCVTYDLIGCADPDPAPEALLDAMRHAAALLGTRIRAELPVTFQPHGSTCVIVLAESHLVVSTWPEHRLAHADLTTCRADIPPERALAPVRKLLDPHATHLQHVPRHFPPSRHTVRKTRPKV